jgi:acetoacetate decarboxylase
MMSAQPQASIGPVFREALLGLRAEACEQEGFYFLSMPVTDTATLVFGHESVGYPRKVASIYFYHDGANVGGWVQRHDVRYFAVRAHLTGIIGSPDAEGALDELFEPAPDVMQVHTYRFKYFRSPSLGGFDYSPRLVREAVEFRPTVIARGPASVSLCPSQYDPWSEVEVIRVLGAIYIEGMASLRTGQVVSEVGPSTWDTPGGLL